jgi:hypothetical protein
MYERWETGMWGVNVATLIFLSYSILYGGYKLIA